MLGVAAWLAPSIRKLEDPLRILALAWIYLLDSVINGAYTTLFGIGWFIVLSQNLNKPISIGGDASKVPGAGTIADTAGFTDPEHEVTHVDVVAHPAPGFFDGQEAVAYGSQYGSLGAVVFHTGSMASITVIGLLCIIRFYFCIIIMSYARSILRSYIASISNSTSAAVYYQSGDPSLAENPFRTGREEGAGWKGQLGRLMLIFPTKRYWLGRDEIQDEWAHATSSRFESGKGTGLRIKMPDNGVGERERRARSGTDPPPFGAGKGKAPS